MFCYSMEVKFLAWNLLELAFYGKLGFFGSDLDGNKGTNGVLNEKSER